MLLDVRIVVTIGVTVTGKGARGASGILIMVCLLIWVVVMQLDSPCENLSGYTLVSALFVCMLELKKKTVKK